MKKFFQDISSKIDNFFNGKKRHENEAKNNEAVAAVFELGTEIADHSISLAARKARALDNTGDAADSFGKAASVTVATDISVPDAGSPDALGEFAANAAEVAGQVAEGAGEALAAVGEVAIAVVKGMGDGM